MRFFARCASGFEDVLAKELIDLKCKRVERARGGASFVGSYADGLRACLWSRVATRIQMELVRTSAHSAETLYAGVYKVPWEKIIAPGATVAMHASGQNAALCNTQFTAQKVKDAVCDRLARERGARPDVDGVDPDFPIDISIYRDRAIVYLNLAGPALHRRGYREPGVQVEAPLKETLAAGVLLAAGWDAMASDGAGFADPMCGSGTLPIEAALIATNTAPGLLRGRWGFESYLRHNPARWSQLVEEARAARISSAELDIRILGGDMNAEAIEVARADAGRAGVADLVEFFVDDAANLGRHFAYGRSMEGGLVACNPPYGYRLNAGESLSGVYAALRAGISQLDGSWQLSVITPDAGIDTGLGRVPRTIVPCHNGPLDTGLRIYDLESVPTTVPVTSLSGSDCNIAVAERASEQFAARFRKVAKERAKWARSSGVSSYRAYDADLPDYAFSVDLFRRADDDATLVRVEEHRAGSGVDLERASRRFSDGLAIIAAVLDIPGDHLFFKRASQKRGAPASEAFWTDVREAEFAFEVDLGSQRECGLPLDMRPVRELIRAEAAGKRFACLLAHAGAPTTYAAAGGAASTVTVDSSKVFLDQAQRVVRANGFDGHGHVFVCADVQEWATRQAEAGEAYDLVFCDLSAFPKPKGQETEAGYLPMLEAAVRLLAPGGKLLLTCHDRRFKLRGEGFGRLGMSEHDITASTIGHDFSRTPKAHLAYVVERISAF